MHCTFELVSIDTFFSSSCSDTAEALLHKLLPGGCLRSKVDNEKFIVGEAQKQNQRGVCYKLWGTAMAICGRNNNVGRVVRC